MYAGRQVARRALAKFLVAQLVPANASVRGRIRSEDHPTRGQEARNLRVYDGQPVHDHFKKIGDNAVMGIMNGKEALDR